jgi:flagellar basal body-associated protein FliL
VKNIFKALLIITGVLGLLLITGTIIGLGRPYDAEPFFRFGSPAQPEMAVSPLDDIRVFSGLGRMRIPLSNSSVMILSIAFPYHANDIAFSEELAAKVGGLRDIAIDYFSSLPQDSLIHIDEEAAKQEILRRFNNNLRLGRIYILYFSDLIIIDGS